MNKKRTINISKTLSLLLRHRGLKEGLTFRNDGYVLIEDVLANHIMVRLTATFENINDIVENYDKKDFKFYKKNQKPI